RSLVAQKRADGVCVLHSGVFVNAETRPDGFKMKDREILRMESRRSGLLRLCIFKKLRDTDPSHAGSRCVAVYSRRMFPRSLCALFVLALTGLSAPAPGAARPPNVVFILTDNQGAWT